MKINASKSLTTTLPNRKIHKDFKVEINGTTIPRVTNQRTLGNYLTEDNLFKKEIEKRFNKVDQILSILPTHLIEPTNLKRIMIGKTISSFVHLVRGNAISNSQLEEIDTKIRGKLKKALNIDIKVAPIILYSPILKKGLNIPNLKHMANTITCINLINKYNSKNRLVKEAIQYSINRVIQTKTKNHNVFEKFHHILKENNLTMNIQKKTPTFKARKEHEEYNQFTVWTDGSKIDGQVGFSTIIQNEAFTKGYKFRLHKAHSNNTAEISAVLTTLHIIPPNSTITIYTDSEITTKIINNSKYCGQFKQFKEEITSLIQEKNLTFTINWTKAHTGTIDGNNYADKKAKEATKTGKRLIPQSLLSHGQLIITTKKNVWKTNIKTTLRQIMYDNKYWPESILPINTNYLKEHTTPTHKYSIWRHMIKGHLRSLTIKNPQCPQCNKDLTTEHLMIDCPKLDEPRKWMINEIKQITQIEPVLSTDTTETISTNIFRLNIFGIIENYNIQEIVRSKWHLIQGTLSLFGGKAQNHYNKTLNIK